MMSRSSPSLCILQYYVCLYAQLRRYQHLFNASILLIHVHIYELHLLDNMLIFSYLTAVVYLHSPVTAGTYNTRRRDAII